MSDELLNPNDVVDAIIAKVQALTDYDTYGIKDMVQLSEEPSPSVRPPYVGFYPDYTETVTQRSSQGKLLAVPTDIYAWIFSSSKKNMPAAFKQAFDIANHIKDDITGEYTVSGKTVKVRYALQPFTILSRAADQSVLQLHYTYEEFLHV